MKKYITIAALLAAGSAFANAAENLTLDMVPSSSWNTLNGVSFGQNSLDELTTGNAGVNWTGSDSLTESWQLSFDMYYPNENAGNTSKLFFTNDGINLSYSDNGLVLTSGSTEKTVSFGSTAPDSTSHISVVLTYLESNNKSSYNSTLFLQVGTSSDSLASYHESHVDFEKTSDNTRFWTNGGNFTFKNLSLKSASAIPEPSAFGLLAGLGALALVGARRRRR